MNPISNFISFKWGKYIYTKDTIIDKSLLKTFVKTVHFSNDSPGRKEARYVIIEPQEIKQENNI